MSTHRNQFAWLAVLLILSLTAAAIPRIVSASLQPDSPLPTPVAPEPYPNSDVYPAVVYLATATDLQVLYDLKIDIGDMQLANGTRNPVVSGFEPSIATVYINPPQSAALSQAGLTPIPILNEGYRSFLAYGPGSGAPNAWPTFEEYVTRMQTLAATHPNIVSLESIGKSVNGLDLWCMEVSDNPGMDENEPEFKYTASPSWG